MTKQPAHGVSRRAFVKRTVAAAAATTAFPYFATGAANNKPLKIGVIGAGWRGTEAAQNAKEADPTIQVVALADLYQDRIDDSLRRLKKRKIEVDKKNCFLGFDAYKKVLDMDLDYVILGTPPYYRPEHLTACVEAGRNVFSEKPVAVDPVGIRKYMAAGKKAAQKGLSIVAGTQRRHQKPYLETIKRIRDGAIGDVVAAQCYWNGGQLWWKRRKDGWSDEEWMHRDWVNWCWLSGDHVVEQHVHNIDIINWVIGTHPESVVAMGGRHRRVTGNQYDFFSSDFTYPGHVHMHSQCRQISGCVNNVSERVIGQKGVSDCRKWFSNLKDYKVDKGRNPYVQEHADLIESIRKNKPLNETQNVAESTLCAIMARISAYTGKEVTWDEMMKSDLVLTKPDYWISEESARAHVPVPGKDKRA